jgi:pimeloyl-ACP methyl ester carboxylesterase
VPDRSLLGSVGPLVGSVASMSPAFLRRLVTDAARAGPFTLMRAARDLLDDDLRDELPYVRASTLVVWGGRDPLVPVRHARTFRSLLPDARLLVLRESWHVPMVEQPEPFSEAVAEFLAGGEPEGARAQTPSGRDATSASRGPHPGS